MNDSLFSQESPEELETAHREIAMISTRQILERLKSGAADMDIKEVARLADAAMKRLESNKPDAPGDIIVEVVHYTPPTEAKKTSRKKTPAKKKKES